MHKVVVSVSKSGQVEIKVDGMPGASCKDITKTIEKALGNTIKDEKTPDYYKTASIEQNIKQNGG